MMIDNRLVGRRISTLRQGGGLTQQQLAAMMNVSHQAVSKWESGQALPDIQTMLRLTRFFGITVEQLVSDQEDENDREDEYESTPASDTNPEEKTEDHRGKKEVKHMNIQQLLQMAPFMSRETVEEIVMEIEGRLTTSQIARVAPYVRPECLEKLIEIHKPELNWDALRRIAPFMSREAVDELARSIASGRESVKPANDCINKTINDIGKAFDDIGKGMGHAMKKAIRFGENVINEVSTAINDLTSEPEPQPQAHVRSERAVALRKKAFERALIDGKWEWIGDHIGELDGDPELRGKIAAAAREAGMNEWICRHMGGFADEYTIEAAIANGDWSWLGDNAWQMDAPMQEKVALAAAVAQEWEWLGCYADQLKLKECAPKIAKLAMEQGEADLAAQIAMHHLKPEDIAQLAEMARAAGNHDALDQLAVLLPANALETMLLDMARKQEWERVGKYARPAEGEMIEKLLEIAVEQGDFDAVDMLDAYL